MNVTPYSYLRIMMKGEMDMTTPEFPGIDPHADAATLYQLASTRPDLRPAIARHPNAYPQLLQWLSSLHDPDVDAALRQRFSAPAQEVHEAPQPDQRPLTNDTEVAAATAVVGAVSPEVPQSPVSPSPEPASHTTQMYAPVPHSSQAPAIQPATQTFSHPGEPDLPTTPEPKKRKGTIIAIVVVALLIAACCVASYFVFFAKDKDGRTEAGQEPSSSVSMSPSVEPSQTQSSSPEPSPTTESPSPEPATETAPTEVAPAPETPAAQETPAAPAIVYPAPGGAIESTFVVAPSGNIACWLTDTYAQCTIYRNNHAARGFSTCGNGTTLVVEDGMAHMSCDSQQVPTSGGTRLEYGSYATHGNFACGSARKGLSCWNMTTGSSFSVARDG